MPVFCIPNISHWTVLVPIASRLADQMRACSKTYVTFEGKDSLEAHMTSTIPNLMDIPKTGFLRLHQILVFLPYSKTTWWEGCRSGRFPKPIKLGPRTTAWRAEDIAQLVKELSSQQEDESWIFWNE